MMKFAISLLLLVLMPLTASAQSTPVYQSGLITHGRLSYWVTNGVVGDAGPASAGNITELGITNTGTPFCINDQLTTSSTGYHQFCLGALALGGGLMNYQAYSGATPLPFAINTDGPIILSSAISNIQAKNLPISGPTSITLCVSPSTGQLSLAATGGECGAAPVQALLLQGGAGYVLLQGGAGRISLQ